MKDVIAQRKKEVAEADGLYPNTIRCGITPEWTKVCMTAAAVSAEFSFSKKILLTKTGFRYRSDHSMMCGYINALIALMTHYLEGPRPSWMSRVRFEKLSDSTLQTIEMVKHATGLDTIYPANPNLILSNDDTTLFVFEEKSVENGDKE